jgi:hypothetical protein
MNKPYVEDMHFTYPANACLEHVRYGIFFFISARSIQNSEFSKNACV